MKTYKEILANTLKKTESEIIAELADNLVVEYKPYGTWHIKSEVRYTDEEGVRRSIKGLIVSHNEEDCDGLFDPEKYNPFFNDDDTTDEQREAMLNDTANEDNYEPKEARNARLAERLYDEVFEELIMNEFAFDF